MSTVLVDAVRPHTTTSKITPADVRGQKLSQPGSLLILCSAPSEMLQSWGQANNQIKMPPSTLNYIKGILGGLNSKWSIQFPVYPKHLNVLQFSQWNIFSCSLLQPKGCHLLCINQKINWSFMTSKMLSRNAEFPFASSSFNKAFEHFAKSFCGRATSGFGKREASTSFAAELPCWSISDWSLMATILYFWTWFTVAFSDDHRESQFLISKWTMRHERRAWEWFLSENRYLVPIGWAKTPCVSPMNSTTGSLQE